VLEAEHIFDGIMGKSAEEIRNAEVAGGFRPYLERSLTLSKQKNEQKREMPLRASLKVFTI